MPWPRRDRLDEPNQRTHANQTAAVFNRTTELVVADDSLEHLVD